MFAISGIEISNTNPIRNILGKWNEKVGLQMAMEGKTGNISSTWVRRVLYILLYTLHPFLSHGKFKAVFIILREGRAVELRIEV